jgi:hypothetical protein
MLNKFKVWVLPGVELVFAKPFRSVNILISDDLPTLLLPMKANSGFSLWGMSTLRSQLPTYSAVLIFIFDGSFVSGRR